MVRQKDDMEKKKERKEKKEKRMRSWRYIRASIIKLLISPERYCWNEFINTMKSQLQS
jgi:hypothetical protein